MHIMENHKSANRPVLKLCVVSFVEVTLKVFDTYIYGTNAEILIIPAKRVSVSWPQLCCAVQETQHANVEFLFITSKNLQILPEI